MAIDIESYGLPVVPSADTGLYELPDEPANRILQYTKVLLEAKDAGVVGAEIKHLDAYINKVVELRVRDARTGGIVWASRCAEMAKEESAWRLRMADHAARAMKREMAVSGLTQDEEALKIAELGESLDEATGERLASRMYEVIGRDRELTRERLPGVDPRHASVHARTLKRLEQSPVFRRAQQLFRNAGPGIAEAAQAMSVWEELSLAERAVLFGPWAEVVDANPKVLEGLWTDEADRLRRSWTGVPEEAFNWYPGRELDEF